MYNHLLFLSYWITNSLVLYFVSQVSENIVRLGNARFNEGEAAVYAGFWMTFILWVFWDFAIARKMKLDTTSFMFFFFFTVNFFAVWAVSRFSHFIGFEQTTLLGIIVITLLTTGIQRLVRAVVVRNSLH